MSVDLPVALPPALDHPPAVRRIYPDLGNRWPGRASHAEVEALTRAARTRYMQTHPCDPNVIRRRYVLRGRFTRGSSWIAVEQTWACDQVPESSRATLRCVADHEGGRDYPDVWFGFSRGWQGGRFAGTLTVVGHEQIRPYHAARVSNVRDEVVTLDTFRVLTDPIHHARAADSIFEERPSAYATVGLCS